MSKSFNYKSATFTLAIILALSLGLVLIYKTDPQETYESLPPQNNNDLVAKTLKIPEEFKAGIFAIPKTLFLPTSYEISLYASNLNKPRFMVVNTPESMFVTDKGSKEVLLLRDNDKNGVIDEKIVVDTKLQTPHGIDLYKNDLYVGEEHQVVVYRNITETGTYTQKDIVVSDLPGGKIFSRGKGHTTRTVKVGPDEKLYVSIGSSCNVCEESDKRRAAIVRYNLDGSGEEIIAEGLRNTVGFVFMKSSTTRPKEIGILGVDNGRDLIGDDLPPEEINLIQENNHYGWPYCYGRGVNNPEYPDKSDFCKNETSYPIWEIQAHSAPLGLNYKPNSTELYIAYHGSWNRTVPTGYKIVRLDTFKRDSEITDFVTGWLLENGSSWGRPVDIVFDANENMYISDDKAGAIYRVTRNDRI